MMIHTKQLTIIVRNSNNIFNHHKDNANHSEKEQQYTKATSILHHFFPSAMVYIFWIFHANLPCTNIAYINIAIEKLLHQKQKSTTFRSKQIFMAASQSPLVARQKVYLKHQQVCTGICPD